jgi:hypothetical protein
MEAYITNGITKGGLKGSSCCVLKSYRGTIKAVAKAAANTAANAAAEAAPEPGRLGEPVVIEPDEGESESHDEGTYAAFEEAIEVKDHEASYL